ncbi:MAG: SagB/ThcOx family dehydrogenase [Bergeyella sp.]|nr:SagB/ThcOx family dehydrogenase [Bergeyella sp.]
MIMKKLKQRYSQKDGSMYGERNIQESLAMLYHENSKFTDYTIREQGGKIAAFNNPYVAERSAQPFKCYPNHEIIDLNDYVKLKNNSNLFQVLNRRRSNRNFDENYKISLFEISNLLYQSYGVTKKAKISESDVEGHIGFRNVPSGGGLYPLEVYIVLFNSHIENGLYHYRPDINALELLKIGDFSEDLNKIIQAEPYVNMKSGSCIILTTGIIERLIIKYGDRGYRFLMQEVGFVAQTISLLAEALHLGSCMLGGYHDDKVNEFLEIDGVFETINNIIVIGKRNENLNREYE